MEAAAEGAAAVVVAADTEEATGKGHHPPTTAGDGAMSGLILALTLHVSSSTDSHCVDCNSDYLKAKWFFQPLSASFSV